MSSKTLLEKAATYRCGGDLDNAIKIYYQVLETDSIEGLNGLGLCFKMEEKYPQALECFKKATQECQRKNELSRIGGIYRDIADTYQHLGQIRQSIEFLQKSISNLQKYSWTQSDQNASLGISYGKLGRLYSKQNNYQEARIYLNKALRIIKKADHDFYLLTIYLYLAEYYLKTQKNNKALITCNKAIELSLANKYIHRLVQGLILKGIILLKAHKDAKSLEIFYQAVISIDLIKSPKLRDSLIGEIDKQTIRNPEINAELKKYISRSNFDT